MKIEPVKKKIKTLEEFIQIRNKLRHEGKKVVFTNGCFDLIHGGHIHIFEEAKKMGDILVVAVNDDLSIKRIKGPNRPVFPLEERMEVLSAVSFIDYLLTFSEDTPQKIVATILPDVLVKGGDWKPDEVVGKTEVEGAGGQVIIIPYLPGHSSSDIIKRVRALV